ncbi:hypothetical protein STEG23_025326 [Scotinomys teguina]
MQAEINRLEKENHALRVKLASSSQTTSGSERESEDEREEAVYGHSQGALPGDIPTESTPAVQEQGNVMIVRRYSISPSAHSYAASDPWTARNRLPNISGTSLAHSSTRNQDNEEKTLAADAYSSNSSSQRAPSDYNFVCRNMEDTLNMEIDPEERSQSYFSTAA